MCDTELKHQHTLNRCTRTHSMWSASPLAHAPLARRLAGLAPGRVRAKTGTLNGVSALCGYLLFNDGRPGAFCLLMNGLTVGAREARALQDELVQVFLDWRRASPAPRR